MRKPKITEKFKTKMELKLTFKYGILFFFDFSLIKKNLIGRIYK